MNRGQADFGERVHTIKNPTGNLLFGPIIFGVTAAATIVFFWWLLIYDHGVASVH